MIGIKKDINYDEFLDTAAKCKGEVTLKSPDISLNLKSVLCRYFALSQLFNNSDTGICDNLELVFDTPEDILRLKDYIEEK